MALIMMSGYPSSGKTHVAKSLIDALSPLCPEHRISLISSNPNPEIFRDVAAEKMQRGEELSAVKREISKEAIVIVDELNYIKGFRYQLYCEARSAGVRHCVVHVGTPIEKCRELNENRNERKYPDDLFDALIFRYEEPNAMTRWDSPLFVVGWGDTLDIDAMHKALFGPVEKDREARPGLATSLPAAEDPSYLQRLDHITQSIVSSILAHQREDPENKTARVDGTTTVLELPHATTISLPQLQRLRKQFTETMRRTRLVAGEEVKLERVPGAFVGFLNDNLE